MRRRALALTTVAALATALAAAIASPVSASASRAYQPHRPQIGTSVDGHGAAAPGSRHAGSNAPSLHGNAAVSWPTAGTATVTLPRPAARARVGGKVRAGTLPVRVGAARAAAGNHLAAAVPSTARVQLLDHTAAQRAGVSGLLMRLAAKGGTSVSVDYRTFAHAYGGDWASRLRLVTLPACATTTPERPQCRQRTPLPTVNDGSTATATVPAAAAPLTLALDAAPAGSAGDYTATKFANTGSWSVSTQSGEFSWSYPIDVPDVPGGLTPDLELAYSSASVDGQTATSNNQPSVVGTGWELSNAFIERSFPACADDDSTHKTGDRCWGANTITLSMSGHSTALVLDSATNTWHQQHDDGTRVELLSGKDNGVHGGQYWKLTDTDGTVYYFGRTTNSAWGVPVFGNDSGEPCHADTFAASSCTQAYRWNLDYAVDVHGNTMSYQYQTETNYYARNGGSSVAYVRAGRLVGISYGTRSGQSGPAPAQITLGYADRCTSGADCSKHSSFPDTPWDQSCSAPPAACTVTAPTFWTTKRLTSITTSLGGTTVDTWRLRHDYPDPGDGTGAGLWLKGIQHLGYGGGTSPVATPEVTFDQYDGKDPAQTFPNRITSGDAYPPMNKFRIHVINNESGGATVIQYLASDCTTATLPKPESNTKRCFPVYWVPKGGQPRTDWFAKYVVSEIRENDGVGGNPDMDTRYIYDSAGGAWRYSDNPLVPKQRRTWSQWRGYAKVTVQQGDPNAEPEAPRSETTYLFFRGMDGDHLPDGSRRAVSIVDSQGHATRDADEFAGMQREVITRNGPGGALVDDTIDTPWKHGPTASHTYPTTLGPQQAWVTGISHSITRTALSAGGWRTTSVDTTLDNLGRPTQVDDHGDTSTTADDQCTTTEYARNTALNLLDLPKRVATVAVACGTTPSYPKDAISDVRTYYDGHGLDEAPTKGDVTTTEQARAYSGSTPSYLTTARATYDAWGRPTSSTDADGRTTTTAYTDTGGLLTAQTATNPLGQQTRTTYDPVLGRPTSVTDTGGHTTTLAYDALGRLSEVWLPGRNTKLPGNLRFGYSISNSSASWQSTSVLQPTGNNQTSYTLYDGFLRERQVQEPAPGAGSPQELGRRITDTFYNSRGLVARTTSPYFNAAAPSGTLQITTGDIPQWVVNTYDGAGRLTDATTFHGNKAAWKTHTAYGGDHVDVTPPAGTTPTTTYVDARGNTTKLLQYHGDQPSGPADTTTYSYTPAGQLASIRDAAGDVWTNTYDLLGRKVTASDPDRGKQTMTYDAAGQLLTSTDARGVTLAYVYDKLGRRVEERSGSASGTLLASWRYDSLTDGTPAVGNLTASTRYVDGAAYTVETTGYDAGNRPTGRRVTIPDTQPGIAGSYTTTTKYLLTGALSSVTLPALGDLRAETLSYTYDKYGNPATLSNGTFDYVSNAIYAALGGLAQLQLNDGDTTSVWQSWFRDPATQRITQALTQQAHDSRDVDRVSYAYDDSGNVTSQADALYGSPVDRQCFRYDYLQRLTEAWTTTAADCSGAVGSAVGGPAPYWLSERYNLMGDRVSQTRHGLGGATDTVSSYAYPPSGQRHAVTSVTTSGPAGTSTAAYAYGPTGDTTSRPDPSGSTQALSWDVEDRLVKAGSASYVYDADGNRLITRDASGVTLFLDSGELHVDPAGTKTGTRYYTFGDASIAVRTGAKLRWTASDNHGTAELALDATTFEATKRRFDPFGNPRGDAGPFPGDRGFVGGVQDTATGLTHLGARDYDPALGRFISVDPLLDPADPQQLNPYEYAFNNPATASDPTGMIGFTNCPDQFPNGCKNNHAPKPPPSESAGTAVPQYHPGHGQTTQFNNEDIWQRNSKKVAFERAQAAAVAEIYQRAEQLRKEREEAAKNHCGDLKLLCDITGVNDVINCVSDPNVSDCVNAAIDIASYAVPEAKAVKVVDEGVDVSRGVKAAKGAARACGESFSPDTQVVMADGSTKPLDQVQVGDKVEATDPATGKTTAQTVTAVWVNRDTDLMDVRVKAGGRVSVVHATAHHLFWDATQRSWVAAQQLRPGDRLRTDAGVVATVVGTVVVSGGAPMWDLSVSVTHDFYVKVSTANVLVHNCPARFGNGGERPPLANSRRNTDAGVFKTREQAMAAAERDAKNYRYASTRAECSTTKCHVHLDIYNNRGELLETRHYTYQEKP